MPPNGQNPNDPSPLRRPVLDPRIAHRRPVVSTAELDRAAAPQDAAQLASGPEADALYGREADVYGNSYSRLSSRPQRSNNDRSNRFLAIIAVVVVLFAGAIYGVSTFNANNGSSDEDDSAQPANGSTGGAGSDEERRSDANTLSAAIQGYAVQNLGKYPSFSQLSSADWRAINLPTVTDAVLTDPSGGAPLVALAAAPDIYAYVVGSSTSEGEVCDNQTINCDQFKIIATLGDGTQYSPR